MTPRLLLVLLCWVACALAIPLVPIAIGPEYLVTFWNMPLFRTLRAHLWGQSVHILKISSQTPGWYDPGINGGQMLDFTTAHYGEPLNIIISGNSDPFVLTDNGIHSYAKSLGFSEECLGLHYGNRHEADLGDGDGRKVEQFLARQDYFPIWGTCWESLAGGHHFRAWKQNGTWANSGAWFIGASKELDYRHHHGIAPNGYNLGRDWIVERATSGGSWQGKSWGADVEWRYDLLEAGSEGVNHGIEQDGRVAVLTVHRLLYV